MASIGRSKDEEAGDDKRSTPSVEGVGISHSTPLVRLPAAPVVQTARPMLKQQQSSLSPPSTASSVVSVTDHPLATMMLPMASPPTMGGLASGVQVELTERTKATATPTATLQSPPPAGSGPPPRNLPLPPPSRSSPAPPPVQTEPTTPVLSVAGPPLPPILSPPVSVAVSFDDLADKFLSGTSTRTEKGLHPLLHPETIPANMSDLERLRILVNRRSWGDVLLVAERLLRGTSSHYAPIYDALIHSNAGYTTLPTLDSQQADLIAIMTILCQAWLKLKRYSDLALEMDRWKFCHHNENSAPSWVPWSMHITAAETLLYGTPDSVTDEAIHKLWAIRQDIPATDAMALCHVDHALSNVFVRRRDWRMVLFCMQQMLHILPMACQQYAQSLFPGDDPDAPALAALATVLEVSYTCEILSRQGRAFLQLGALEQADRLFCRAQSVWDDRTSSSSSSLDGPSVVPHKDMIVSLTPSQLLVNQGLLAVSRQNNSEAMDFFRQAIQLVRRLVGYSLSMPDLADPPLQTLLPSSMGMTPVDMLYAEAINNLAVCALYTCRVREALLLMESLVRDNPTRFLSERVALNLCTMYELSNESSVAARKKRVIQQIAKRFALHDIPSESFRL